MNTVLRLAFLLPALLLAAPATAQPTAKRSQRAIHYVMLDKMIHDFAAQARGEQVRVQPTPSPHDVVIAQR